MSKSHFNCYPIDLHIKSPLKKKQTIVKANPIEITIKIRVLMALPIKHATFFVVNSHPRGFTDFFSWASNPQLSAYRGQRLVAGRPCTIWALRLKLGMSMAY